MNRICKQRTVSVLPYASNLVADDSSPLFKRTRSPKGSLIDNQPYIDKLKIFTTKERAETEEEKEARKQQEIQQQ